jgi:UDP-glucuronate 4-epimerase
MLRFFTVYGPRGRPDMAVFKFVDAVENLREFERFGNGQQLREFTYIDDIVDGLVSSVRLVLAERQPLFEIVNLGGGAMHTVNDLIAEVQKATGKTASFRELPEQPGDVPLTNADQTKAKALLGFQPRISLAEGVARTVAWYRAWKLT